MTGVITTTEAKCRDCYRCLRACPVQAIGFRTSPEGTQLHARVDDAMCILDGRCVLACPQKAKRVRDDRERVKELLAAEGGAVASIAPSFPGALPLAPEKVPGLVRRLGFRQVHETAAGAFLVANAHLELLREGRCRRPLLTSSCPVIVNILERHHPEVLPFLAPVVSPMVAHARLLRLSDPGARVVFIGPCIAKKREAALIAPDAVAAVLTFRELWDLWEEAGLVRDGEAVAVDEQDFDPPHPGVARLFPLDGGLLRSAGLPTDFLSGEVAVVTGLEQCFDLIRELARGGPGLSGLQAVEMLACEHGCVGGPKAIAGDDVLARRQRVLAYHGSRADGTSAPAPSPVPLGQSYRDRRPDLTVPDEATIRAILARVGKTSPADELNCGACGYDSCRAKAIAVYQGYAEPEMCIPYMRAKAESVSSLVLDALPSGVVVVDRELRLLEINAAARRMFASGKDGPGVGDHVSRLTDPAPFRAARSRRAAVSGRVDHRERGLVTQQTVFYVSEHDIVVGIFTDVTREEREREQAEAVRSATIARAQEVMDKQMKVAQEIAGLLGETTAETKVLLTKLIRVIREASPPSE